MSELAKPQLVVYAAAALAIALIGARYLHSVSAEATAAAPGAMTVTGPTGAASNSGGRLTANDQMVVHVAGAVRRPGVVKLRQGKRVADAIEAVGGWANAADRAGVNLAARVTDGQQIVVPARGSAGERAEAASSPSLGSASVEELTELDGIGPGLAEKIVEHRARLGGFRSIDQLVEVPGIGEKRLESLRTQLQP